MLKRFSKEWPRNYKNIEKNVYEDKAVCFYVVQIFVKSEKEVSIGITDISIEFQEYFSNNGEHRWNINAKGFSALKKILFWTNELFKFKFEERSYSLVYELDCQATCAFRAIAM